MKKIIIILSLMCAVTAYSQIDTIHGWQRIPGMFYEDSNWWDHYCFDVPCEYPGLDYNVVMRIPFGDYKKEYARNCYTDTAIRIIGIAASAAFTKWDNSVDTVLAHRPNESFRLYKADTSGMEFLREAQWHATDSIRFRNSVSIWQKNRYNYVTHQNEIYYEEDIMDLYEAYFDKPVIVKDSFYVSATSYGNYVIPDTTIYEDNPYGEGPYISIVYNKAFQTVAYFASMFAPFLPKNEQFAPRRDYYKVRDLEPDSAHNYGEWQIIPGSDDHDYNHFYMNIFPIIDTTFRGVMPQADTCPTPQGLRVGQISNLGVFLEWENVAERYQISLTPDGGTETIETSEAPFIQLTGLDTATWYMAKVRAECDSEDVSLWSDTLRFFVPGDTTSTGPTESIETIAERFTYLMPNPASDNVTVMSSFRIDRIEVYSLTGQRVMQQKVGALSTQIDLSCLPKGTYIVRTYTNHGISNKRLVVK